MDWELIPLCNNQLRNVYSDKKFTFLKSISKSLKFSIDSPLYDIHIMNSAIVESFLHKYVFYLKHRFRLLSPRNRLFVGSDQMPQ